MKLVLFDLDGTLTDSSKPTTHESFGRENKWVYAIRKVFNKNAVIDFDFNGRIDKQILWMASERLGISRGEFNNNVSHLRKAMYDFFIYATRGQDIYYAIEDAKQLIDIMKDKKNIVFGILTGNITEIAMWKLRSTGYDDIFDFGLFGEEADDRIDLAKSVFRQAKAYFHKAFSPNNIVVIGDTIYDIRCGKAIGAFIIGVTSKGKKQEVILQKEGADIVVNSLMDKKILDFFGVASAH